MGSHSESKTEWKESGRKSPFWLLMGRKHWVVFVILLIQSGVSVAQVGVHMEAATPPPSVCHLPAYHLHLAFSSRLPVSHLQAKEPENLADSEPSTSYRNSE